MHQYDLRLLKLNLSLRSEALLALTLFLEKQAQPDISKLDYRIRRCPVPPLSSPL